MIAVIQQPSDTTLAQFLMQNEGKRCVVVLDVRLIKCRVLLVLISTIFNRKLRKPKTRKLFGHY